MANPTEWWVRDRLWIIEDHARTDLWWHRHRDKAAGLEVADEDAPGLSLIDVEPEPESRKLLIARRKRERAVRSVLRQVPKVREAAESGDPWATADAALELTARVSRVNMLEADAVITGRERRSKGARAGRKGRVASNNKLVEKLCERVAFHLDRDPSLSHWGACRAVAAEWNRLARRDQTISPDTVKRHTIDVRQRLRPR